MPTYACGPAPEIHILSVNGNLDLRGWERAEISSDTPLTRASDPRLTDESPAEERSEDGGLVFSIQGNASLRLPLDASVTIDRVAGNVSLRHLPEGVITLGRISGNLSLKRLGDVTLAAVDGNLEARALDGDLHVGQVGGQAQVREVSGSLTLERVHGSLEARQVEGLCLAQVDGSAELRTSFQPGGAHRIRAGGGINCRLEPDVSLGLQLHSGSERIYLRLPEGGSQNYRQRDLTLTLGAGDGSLELEADGALYLSVRAAGWEGAAGETDDFADTLQAQMEALHQQINAQLGQFNHMFGPLSAPPTPEQLQRAQARAAERAQERLQRAQEKLARKAENERRRAEMRAEAAQRRAAGRRGPTWSSPNEAAPSGASDEERLIILRMLEQKKITLQEAELLLSALEGPNA